MKILPAALLSSLLIVAGAAHADEVIPDDLIVDGNACVGLDCVNGESFGFTTLRLKENNLRIEFRDTSTTAAFPSTDWQLTANDTNNGGDDHFSIEDLTAGTTPFRVEGGAPDGAAIVKQNGDLEIAGNLNALSDVAAKADFAPVEGEAVLERLEALPIRTWRYKRDDSGARHLGPTAQDFRAAFALGADERHISPMDAAGVALVGVKELHEELERKDARIDELSGRIDALEALLERLADDEAASADY